MQEPHYRVVHVKCFGDPDGLEVVDAGLPTAGRDEVRVRVSNRSAMVRHCRDGEVIDQV